MKKLENAVNAVPRIYSSAHTLRLHPEQVHRLYGEGRKPFPGLPQHHEPLIKSYYDLSLLSITNPPVVLANAPLNTHHYSTHQSLLLVNRQINGELTSHFNLPRNRRTSVFASFPYGLYILKKTAPRLLHQAQSIHIAGKYSPSDFIPERAACTGEHHPHIPIKHHGNFAPNSSELLGQLIAATFGPVPIYHVRKFEMRVYYPGDDSYSTVWGDDSSPTVVALRNICNAEVGIEVWRGRYGTGIYLCATPTTERKRVVSTVWRKLEEGRRDQPGCGSW